MTVFVVFRFISLGFGFCNYISFMRWIGIYMDMGTSTDTVWMDKMDNGSDTWENGIFGVGTALASSFVQLCFVCVVYL